MLPKRTEGPGDAALVVEVEELSGDDEQQPVGEGGAQVVLVGVREGAAQVEAGGARSEGPVERDDVQGAHETDRRTSR